jgi:hypothetical protein
VWSLAWLGREVIHSLTSSPSGASQQLRREAQSLEIDDLAIAKAGFVFSHLCCFGNNDLF